MASSSGGAKNMEKALKSPSLLSPLKRLTKKLSGSARGVRKKSNTKSSETNVRNAKGSSSSRTFGISGTSPKLLAGRHPLINKGHESTNSGRMSINSARHAILAKRLVASRLGTIRSGTDNRLHLNKAKLLKREKAKSNRHPAAAEEISEIPIKKSKDIECDDTSGKRCCVDELKALFGRSCDSEYEMYQLLDERDKILSKVRVRSAHVEDANVIQGTCMDMCPEKERYLRVVQKRISPYECNIEGKMMPNITVKDYSRSAADQEEPLPHELRPAEVLSRTMNYLIKNIANEIPNKDEELCVWYDFLWNRTRAIRKDITQQMMVNETAVVLNEQCARFHIFAAHRLCKLDSNEFDQKMNTENLSKCLQSLRHLYEDLGKRGVFCKSEAEFRAYDIMLNLADSYISRQVLSYRPEIRTSPPVKFALQLFASYQSGNYRRFFKLLIEKADYLQCCVCHRYFSIFREHSLSTIVEAFTASGSAFAKFPLHKLTGLLGFDDDDQSREMVKFYGFECKLDLDCREEYVLLSRSEFIQPKERPILMHNWIERKKDSTPPSMVLSGGVEIVVESWEPVVSFRNGKYCNDPVVNEFISCTSFDDDRGILNGIELSERETSKGSHSASIEVADTVQSFLNIVVDELTEVEVFDIAVRTFSSATVDAATHELLEVICGTVIKNVCDTFVKKIESKQRAISNKRLLEKKKEEVAEISKMLSAEFIDKTIFFFLQKICNRFFNENILKQKALDELAVKLFKDLSTETIRSTICISCKNVLTESAQLSIKCSEIRHRLDRLWLKQFFDQWKINVMKKKLEFEKVQRVLCEFPVILPVKSNLTTRQAVPLVKDYTPSVTLYEEKVEVRRQKRIEDLMRRVFLHWYQWTKRRVLRSGFLNGFVAKPSFSRKRRYSLRSGLDLTLRRKLLLNEERFEISDIADGRSVESLIIAKKNSPEIGEDVRIALCDIDAIATPKKKWAMNVENCERLKEITPSIEKDFARFQSPSSSSFYLDSSKNEMLRGDQERLKTLRRRFDEFEKDLDTTISKFDVDVSKYDLESRDS